MVRPPKPGDIKQTIPGQKSHPKTLKSEIDERYRTEAPQQKKIVANKLKNQLTSPKTSLQAKNASQKPKIVSPKTSKLSRTQAQPSPTTNRRNSISQSKSHTSKPGSPVVEKQLSKTRKPAITKKKSPLETKSDPLNRLKTTETQGLDKTSLLLGFPSEEIESKIKAKLGKMGKVVLGTKKVKKSSLKKPSKEMKNLSIVKPESAASLTTNFRIPYLNNEFSSTLSPTTGAKVSSSKKRRTSTVQKRVIKTKADQEESSKEAKSKRKKSYIKRRVSVGIGNPVA